MLGGAVRQEESWCEEGPRWQACGAVTIARARGAQEPALSCICPHLPPSAAPFSGCLQPPSLGVPSSLGWNNLTFCAHFVLYLKEETFSQLKKKKQKPMTSNEILGNSVVIWKVEYTVFTRLSFNLNVHHSFHRGNLRHFSLQVSSPIVCLMINKLKWFLQEGTATHSSILAWRIPRTEEPDSLESKGSQRVRHDWAA